MDTTGRGILRPRTCVLPGLGMFESPDHHRAWYRANIVTLVSRADLNNTKIAAAVGVSGRTVADWFVGATGMSPHDYRAKHKLAKHTTWQTVVAPEVLAGIPRLENLVPCWDGVSADVVVDLRGDAARARVPLAEVLATAPSDQRKQWRREVSPLGEKTSAGWVLHGYGLGTNKEYAASVLLATDRAVEGVGAWRMVVVTDGRAHGKFALSWAEEVLPGVAETLRMSGGTTREARMRHDEAVWVARRSLDALAVALDDPQAWVGDRGVAVTGLDDETEPWSQSVPNLELLLAWAAAGVTRRDLLNVFHYQRWGVGAAYVLRDYLGVNDFDVMACALAGKGQVDMNHVAWLVHEYQSD